MFAVDTQSHIVVRIMAKKKKEKRKTIHHQSNIFAGIRAANCACLPNLHKNTSNNININNKTNSKLNPERFHPISNSFIIRNKSLLGFCVCEAPDSRSEFQCRFLYSIIMLMKLSRALSRSRSLLAVLSISISFLHLASHRSHSIVLLRSLYTCKHKIVAKVVC